MATRGPLRRMVIGLLTGTLTVSAAWAGVGLAPVKDLAEVPSTDAVAGATGADSTAVTAAALTPGAGNFLVGAAKVNIAPRPQDFPGAVWQKSGCETMGDDAGLATLTHVPDFRVNWPEKPGCLYMGGYGIGPMNAITSFDQEYGLWVRTMVISDGTDELVLSVIDGTSYFGEYNKMCRQCGAFTMAKEFGPKFGFDPAGFMLASTHSHTAPDFIGGWGGVPDWYMIQVYKDIANSIRDAFRNLQPARIEAGEVMARERSAERRDFYRSAEDNALSWLRAYSATYPHETIATVGAFAAHPVTADEGPGIANADFPGPFAKRLEERFGGIGMFFQTGLGNLSPRGSTVEMGNGLAALVPDSGTLVTGTDVQVKQTFWDQPITNIPLGSLGTAGFFDRKFSPGTPGVVDHGEHETRRCRSASPLSVRTAVSAARVGNLRITGAPGETFANLSNTIEEKSPWVSFPLAQVNDGLGYIVQSFETDHVGRQGAGFVGGADPDDPPGDFDGPAPEIGVAEYEDAYSIDHCFGDAVLENTLGIL